MWEGNGKLCYEFKFSYIGGDFSILYIYANRNELNDKVLRGELVYLRQI